MKNTLWGAKWELLSNASDKIGQGGQGVVRRVVKISTGELGALKELIHFTNPERRKRMHIEAASLAVLEHENICKLLDSDTTSEGKLYLVTEFIDGETLQEEVEKQPFNLEEIIYLSRPLLSAIHHSHSVGVFHRDIKPENILIRGGLRNDPVLIDFGISFNQEEKLFSAATYQGQQLGNRFLHLPELHRGASDPRSDLTQICGVLLFALTAIYPISLVDELGNHPHQHDNVRAIINNLKCHPASKDRLLRVFDKAFQVKLGDRWQTAKDLNEALENVIMTEEPETDLYDLNKVRRSLEGDPSRGNQILTRSLYNDFMSNTYTVVEQICSELGKDLASQKQGGARQDLNAGEFGSHFGVVLPKIEVYVRLNGKLIGEELVLLIQDDNTVISRFDAKLPNWNVYRENLKREYIRRLNVAIGS